MKVTFMGATGTVTGSRFLVEGSGSRILVDCGLFQGLKALRLRNWDPFPVDPASIDLVVLTHAHIDHSGYLPRFVRLGFEGRILATPATIDLCGLLLPDAAYLQEEEARFRNAHGYTKHRPALPLYTREDAERALALMQPVEYGRKFRIGKNRLTLELLPAGHILGSAFARFSETGGAMRSLVFTGAGTRGRSLVEGAGKIKLFGNEFPVRASVHTIEAFSAHADYAEILTWLEGFRRPPARTFLVHGEPSALEAMKGHIAERFNSWKVSIPEFLDEVELNGGQSSM